MRGSQAFSSTLHRIPLRRLIAAEAVDQRNAVEHLLIQRGASWSSVIGRSSRAYATGGVARRSGARRRRTCRGQPSSTSPTAASAATIRRVAPLQPVDRQRRERAEADERHHPEARRDAQPLEAGQSRISQPYGAW